MILSEHEIVCPGCETILNNWAYGATEEPETKIERWVFDMYVRWPWTQDVRAWAWQKLDTLKPCSDCGKWLLKKEDYQDACVSCYKAMEVNSLPF